jgi:hypothetical protein
MTDCRPSDRDDGPPLTVNLEEPRSFNFERMLESEHLIGFSGVILISIAGRDLRTALADFVLEYTLTGTIRARSGPIGDAMVEYGVSRFKNQASRTDEPLAIIGLVFFVERNVQTYAEYLGRDLNASYAPYRGIVFEAFGAYLLARAFSVPAPLSSVFEFVEGSKYDPLQDELAEPVTLEMVEGHFQATPLNIKKNRRSCHVLGCSPSTIAETLEWLRNPQGSAFCFPENHVGPGLIFVLRLTNKDTVLRVCVQFKHTQRLSETDSSKAIRTTDPSTWLSHKKQGSDLPTCSNSPMRAEMENAVKALGNGTKEAGPCGLLRVVFSHPTLPSNDALEEAVKGKGSHPIATVLVGHLESPTSTLGQTILSLAALALQLPGRKTQEATRWNGYRDRWIDVESSSCFCRSQSKYRPQ